MSKIILGEAGMIEQPNFRTYVQGRGWTWARRWIGPKENAYGLEQQLVIAGYDIRTQEDGPNTIIEGTVGARDDTGGQAETPIATWERYVNRFEKSLYEHPSFAGLSDEVKFQVKEAVDSYQRGEPISPMFEQQSTDEQRLAFQLYSLIKNGVEVTVLFQPVVRLTQTASSRFDRSSASATGNVGKVLTKAQMKSLEGAPESVLDDKTVPTGIQSIARYGYLKGDSQVIQQAKNQWQIVTEWEAGFWAKTPIYENAT